MSRVPDLIRLTSPDGRLSAFVAPDQGAELFGLDRDGRELLYRGRDFSPPAGWTGRAPILWPAIGRTFAPGPEPTAETFKQAPLGWTVQGVDYPMPLHGFARSLPWQVEDRTASTLRLVLVDTDQTRIFYPFGFRHTLDYTLTDGLLILSHQVDADVGNAGPMPFALGNHATFVLPPGGAGSAETTLLSNATHRMILDAAGRPTGQTIPCSRFAAPVPVSTIDSFDVIPLSATPDHPWARLTYQSGLCVTVSHDTSDPALSKMEFLTLWGDPGGGYLSLEAWLGQPNALATGEGACSLTPGSSQRWTISIEVSQSRRPDGSAGVLDPVQRLI